MPHSRDHAHSGSAVLLSAVAGAALGAAGVGWWLLREAERRRRQPLAAAWQEQRERVDLPRSNSVPLPRPASDGRLQDRVQQLNQAIDEVRRQLEQLQTHS